MFSCICESLCVSKPFLASSTVTKNPRQREWSSSYLIKLASAEEEVDEERLRVCVYVF